MALYQFQADDGSVIEREYPMAQAPALGSALTVDGKTYRRVVCAGPQVGAGVRDRVHGYPKRSIAAPQWSGKGVPGVSHDPQGHVVFANPAAKRDYCRATPGWTTDLG